MKVFLLCMSVLICVGWPSVSKADGLHEPKFDSNLLINIVESKEIHMMTARNKWTCIAGNRTEGNSPMKSFGHLIAKDKDQFNDAKLDFQKQMKLSGHLFLNFYKNPNQSDYFAMNHYQVTWQKWLGDYPNKSQFPKLATTCDDLIWLCKNKWLLTRLSRGKLRPEDYRFSVKEWTLVMRLCPEGWAPHLVAYAVADAIPYGQSKEDDYLRIMINTLTLQPKEKSLKQFPYLLGVDTVKKFYLALMTNNQTQKFNLLETDFFLVVKKLRGSTKLEPNEAALIQIVLNSKLLNRSRLNGFIERKNIRAYIIKYKDWGLLKAYLYRVERRQSIADIPELAQFLQSDLYLKGTPQWRHLILDQCALRQENEIVWQLAESLNLPSPKVDAKGDHLIEQNLVRTVKDRAKAIMMKFTKKDLGDDPKAWKQWYRDQ